MVNSWTVLFVNRSLQTLICEIFVPDVIRDLIYMIV